MLGKLFGKSSVSPATAGGRAKARTESKATHGPVEGKSVSAGETGGVPSAAAASSAAAAAALPQEAPGIHVGRALSGRFPDAERALENYLKTKHCEEQLEALRDVMKILQHLDDPGLPLNVKAKNAEDLFRKLGDVANVSAQMKAKMQVAIKTLKDATKVSITRETDFTALKVAVEQLADELRNFIGMDMSADMKGRMRELTNPAVGLPLPDRKAEQLAAKPADLTRLNRILDGKDRRGLEEFELFADQRIKGHHLEALIALRSLRVDASNFNEENPGDVMALGDRVTPLYKTFLASHATQSVGLDQPTAFMFEMSLSQLASRRETNPGQLGGVGKGLKVALDRAHEQLYANVMELWQASSQTQIRG